MASNHRAASPRGFAAQTSSSYSSSSSSSSTTKNLRGGGFGFSIRGTFSSSGGNVAPMMGRGLVFLLLVAIVVVFIIARASVVRRRRRRRRQREKKSSSSSSLTKDVSKAGEAFAEAIPRLDVGEGERDATDAVLFASAVEKYAEAVYDAPGTKSAFIAAATERRRLVSSAARREKAVDASTSKSRKNKKGNGTGAVAVRAMPVGLTSEEPEVSSVATTTMTTSMCEEDRALLREELEVRKQEVESRKTSNLISFVSLMQKQTSNAIMAEGNKIAADGVAESKAERAERANRLCVERFHRMTCDALASGLSVACVSTIYFGWHEVTARFSELTTRCGGVDGAARTSIAASLLATPFHSVSYAACVVNEGTRALLGILLILAIAVSLSRVRVTRQFRTTPMFVLFLILGFGVGSVGSRAVFALGGDKTHWLLAWRLYLTLIACVTASTPVIARTIGDRVDFKWAYHVCVGLLLPLVVGRSAFPPRVDSFWSAFTFSPGARAQNYYYYV